MIFNMMRRRIEASFWPWMWTYWRDLADLICRWTRPGTSICMEPVLRGLMRTLSPQVFKRLTVKVFSSKRLDVSTPKGIFETMDYVIKAEVHPKKSGSQLPRMVRVYEPPSNKSPDHSWSESRDNYGLIMKQVKVRTNIKTPPHPAMVDDPGPNDNLRKLRQPPPTPNTTTNVLAHRNNFLIPTEHRRSEIILNEFESSESKQSLVKGPSALLLRSLDRKS